MLLRRAHVLSLRSGLIFNFNKRLKIKTKFHNSLQSLPLACQKKKIHILKFSSTKFQDWAYYKYLKKNLFHPGTFFIGLASGIIIGFLSLKNLIALRQKSVEAISNKFQDENVQETLFGTISRELLQFLARDKELKTALGVWMLDTLKQFEQELSQLFAQVLSSQIVYDIVKSTAQQLINDLCVDENIKKKISELFIDVIFLESTTAKTTEWLNVWVKDESVHFALKQLVKESILYHPEIIEASRNFAVSVVSKTLSNPVILSATKHHLMKILQEERFQTHASDVAWGVLKKTVAPRWFNSEVSQTP